MTQLSANNHTTHTSKRMTLLCLLMLLTLLPAAAQDIIRVTGRVVSKKGQPLFGVNIIDASSKQVITQTDEDGRFAKDIRSNATLVFSMVGAEKQSAKVKGRNYIEVQLSEEDIFLGEATVQAARITDKVMVEETDIELKGNYMHVRTRVRVPDEMFASNTRLVAQPVLHNVTRNTDIVMTPIVLDAKNYNRTQQRMYDFAPDAPEGDPLAPYITVKSDKLREKGKKNDIIGYTDSIYVDHVKDDYCCNVFMAIENYRRILYRDTTTIARGTVNPLRWLDYSLTTSEVTDTALFPKIEKQLRDTKGYIDLRFPKAKDKFEVNDPHNRMEIEKLADQALTIQSQKGSKLEALNIVGTSSPEGSYQSNLTLAQKRMNYALNYLKGQISEEARNGMKFNAKGTVASWHDVAALMRKDSLNAEADMVERIDAKYKDTAKSRAMRKLGFYDELLEKRYLPMLRTVNYTMNYSTFRQLTAEEIKELYKQDYRQLSRFEFFTLYRTEQNPELREHILRQTLEIYPSFMVAANDLSVMMTRKGEPDPDILERFVGKKAPEVVNCNQMAALLMTGRYASADSLSALIPETENTRYMRAICDIFNGRIEPHFAEMAATGKRNEVVMLLAMKKNEEALKASLELPEGEALTHYLRATCYNRSEKQEDPTKAEQELKKAIQMNPELEKIAYIDGDVNDLLIDRRTGQMKKN